jgi:predicted lipoprotein
MEKSREAMTATPSPKSAWIFWTAAAVLLAGLFYFFPLFHIVPLQQARQDKAAELFNPAKFAERFWFDHLLKSLDKATKAEVLLPAIQSDSAAARRKYGRTLGMSETYTYFISGTGRVTALSNDEISLTATGGATNAEVTLQTGLIFGNAVRDGTGLLDVNDFPNSQDFNGIAEALNHIVETRVLSELRRQAKVGARIRFVGCAEVGDESVDLHPLRIVPIKVELE